MENYRRGEVHMFVVYGHSITRWRNRKLLIRIASVRIKTESPLVSNRFLNVLASAELSANFVSTFVWFHCHIEVRAFTIRALNETISCDKLLMPPVRFRAYFLFMELWIGITLVGLALDRKLLWGVQEATIIVRLIPVFRKSLSACYTRSYDSRRGC